MREWERRIRHRIAEAAEVRRFVEAQARKIEAEASLRRSETEQVTVETQVNELNRKNTATDNFLMAVARNRTEQRRINRQHVASILGKDTK